jgi:hypothetical protein
MRRICVARLICQRPFQQAPAALRRTGWAWSDAPDAYLFVKGRCRGGRSVRPRRSDHLAQRGETVVRALRLQEQPDLHHERLRHAPNSTDRTASAPSPGRHPGMPVRDRRVHVLECSSTFSAMRSSAGVFNQPAYEVACHISAATDREALPCRHATRTVEGGQSRTGTARTPGWAFIAAIDAGARPPRHTPRRTA